MPSGVTFTPLPGSPTSTPWMTVLAMLAHEVGHVRWFEANARSGYGTDFDFKRLNDCLFFLGWQNQTAKSLAPRGRWRSFGDTRNVNVNDHQNFPTLDDFANATNNQDRNSLLNSLLSNTQPWVSYFGANAPDEDFVETYKFSVLIDAGLASLP